MASLGYLWKNRSKYSFLSKAYLKSWAKRMFSIKQLLVRNFRRIQLIKKGAAISKTAEIGDVSFMGKKSNLRIGNFSFLGRVRIALHNKVEIGNYVCINDGVELLTASHDVRDSEWTQLSSPITINDYVWIATNAIILPGVTIGKGAVIGAGAVVSKDVESFSIVIGNPAIVLQKKRIKKLTYNPCEFVAANRAWTH